MPELPEVETYKRYFDNTSLNQVIKAIKVRDDRILEIDKLQFIKALANKQFISTSRHGKNLFVKFEDGYLYLHFGMSGDLSYFKEIAEEPTHSRVLFEFKEGNFLSYISQRMFGRVSIISTIEEFIKNKNLGPDALNMSFDQFKQALTRRSGNTKTVLMNQEVIAGIGNIYSDEILYQSRVHPKTKINILNDEQLHRMFEIIKKVLNYGIQKEGILESYSQDYLIPHREKEGKCPRCGTELQRITITGRHGFFCPTCQTEL